MDADVAVIGVGSVGSMALWRLRRTGLDVIGFEQFNPGHAYGGAGGESRYFRTAYAEGKEYVPLLLSAYDLWAELEALSKSVVSWKCKFITIGPLDEGRFADAKACADAAGVVCEILDRKEAMRRYPQHRYHEDDHVLLDPQGGIYASEHAVASAARVAEDAGAVIRRRQKVDKIEPDATGVSILTQDRTYRVAKVVMTMGGWAMDLMPELRPVVKAKRTWQSWYHPIDPGAFAMEKFPPFGRSINGTRLHGAPSLDGRSVCIGAVDTLPEDLVVDPCLGTRLIPCMDVVNDYVRDYLPGLTPDPVRLTPAVDGYSTDDHAFVGTHPGSDRVIILCGFSGHGFKLAPVMGQIATDFVLTGRTSYPIDHLALNRFGSFTISRDAEVKTGIEVVGQG